MAGQKLNARRVAALVKAGKPGKFSDGDGLYLKVRPTSAPAWIFVYERRIGVKYVQTEISLGRVAKDGADNNGGLTLAEARDKAGDLRRMRTEGLDPKPALEASRMAEEAARVTFGEFADQYIAKREGGWRNDKHRAQWKMTLGDAYCSALRSKPLGSITRADVVRVLEPVIAAGKWETASRLQQRIAVIFDAATAEDLFSGPNPAAKAVLKHSLSPRPKMGEGAKAHHAAMAFDEVPGLMERLRALKGVSARALEFTIHTAARTGEVIGATWTEIDLEKRLWRIPASRMKAGRDHAIPLTDAAIAVLARVKAEEPHPVWVFPGQARGKGIHNRHISNMAMLQLLDGMALDVTVHGMRAAFRSWAAARTSFAFEVAEAALAHVAGDATVQAYMRDTMLERRRSLMEAWSAFLAAAPAENVVKLRDAG